MRCFVAVFPPEEIRAAAADVAGRICTPLTGVKMVPPGNMHLTCRFIGEIPDGDAARLAGILGEAGAGFSPFRARFSGLGAFPSVHRASVLWAGLGEGMEGFMALAGRINSIASRYSQNTAEKPAVPHLTMARFRAPVDLSRLEVFTELMQTGLGVCAISSFALMRSHLGPAGPVYEELCSYGLKP